MHTQSDKKKNRKKRRRKNEADALPVLTKGPPRAPLRPHRVDDIPLVVDLGPHQRVDAGPGVHGQLEGGRVGARENQRHENSCENIKSFLSTPVKVSISIYLHATQ